LTWSWGGGRTQLPPEPHASLGEFAGRAQWVQGQGPCTPLPPSSPSPSFMAASAGWSCGPSQAFRSWPESTRDGSGVLHVLPWAPTQPSSLIQAPISPTRLWGVELGEAVPGWGAGCACHQLTADGSCSSEMTPQTAAINTSIKASLAPPHSSHCNN